MAARRRRRAEELRESRRRRREPSVVALRRARPSLREKHGDGTQTTNGTQRRRRACDGARRSADHRARASETRAGRTQGFPGERHEDSGEARWQRPSETTRRCGAFVSGSRTTTGGDEVTRRETRPSGRRLARRRTGVAPSTSSVWEEDGVRGEDRKRETDGETTVACVLVVRCACGREGSLRRAVARRRLRERGKPSAVGDHGRWRESWH